MKQNKIDKAIWECYTRLYKVATPSADFDKLVEEANINEDGQKVIPFDNYEIEEKLMDEIITNVIKEYKIPKYSEGAFKATIYLGCSPKTKR